MMWLRPNLLWNPNPGSITAERLGCTCPVLDNNLGRGWMSDALGQPVFVYNFYCRVHFDAELTTYLAAQIAR